jgi:hypothetical protein
MLRLKKWLSPAKTASAPTPNRESKIAALRSADFGFSTAEQDEVLWDTFVETDLWSSVFDGRIDVVLGAKGSGKSAIYTRLFSRSKDLRRRGIELVGAEGVADDPVFRELPNVPTLTGRQFVALWKLYFLTLIGAKLRELRLDDPKASAVITTLEESELLPREGESRLIVLFQKALRYVQVEMEFEAGGGASPFPIGVTADAHVRGKIVLHQPTDDQRKQGLVSAQDLLLFAGDALARKKLTLWLLVDRLDIAFPSADDALEAKSLRTLLQAYIDLLVKRYRVSLKLFLRDDVWERITRVPGDPIIGADAVRRRSIRWSDSSLVNLAARRIVHCADLCRVYNVSAAKVKKDFRLQEELVNRILPPGLGPTNEPVPTIQWILEQLRDGAGGVAPRELVLLLIRAQEIQLDRFSLHIDSVEGHELFERDTIIDALRQVSNFRLFETLCLEYPHLTAPISQLRGANIRQTIDDLSSAWRRSSEDSHRLAEQLVSVGFFQRGTTTDRESTFYVAPLYRHALGMRDRGLAT